MTSPLKLCGQNVLIFGIKHPQEGVTNNVVFCSDRIRTLVAMATYTSHRLIMETSGNCKILLSHWRYLSFILEKFLLSTVVLYVSDDLHPDRLF